MDDSRPYAIEVEVSPRFMDEHSAPEDGRYAFAYTIRILNRGTMPARLISRHWRITDGEGRVEHVDGEGVVGEQPRLQPGDDYEYSSGVVLPTSLGTMQGSYELVADDGTRFKARIPAFTLSTPRTLH